MLMIRFQRIGRANDPAFRIVVLEKERAAKAGNIVELLGTYNPHSKALTLNEEHVKEWIAKGAQPTDSIRNLLIGKGVIKGNKVNVLPRKTPQQKENAQLTMSSMTAEISPGPIESGIIEKKSPIAGEVGSAAGGIAAEKTASIAEENEIRA